MLLSVISRVQRGRRNWPTKFSLLGHWRPGIGVAPRSARQALPPGVRPSACPRGPAASLLRVWLPRTPGPRRRLPSCGACNYPGPAAAAAQVRRLRLPRVGGCGCPGPAAAATSPAAGRFPAGQAVSEHPGSASGPLRGPSSGPQRRGDHVTTDHLNGSRNGAHSSGVSARAVVRCSVLDMKIFGRKA
jgi:hypothetical protein